MIKSLLVLVAGLFLATSVKAITVNPASAVTADSAATPLTVVYRDASGDFAVDTINASSQTISGGYFQVGGSSFVVNNGVVYSTTQYRTSVGGSNSSLGNSVWQPIFFTTEVLDKGNLWVSASSATFTIPPGGGGWWTIDVSIQYALEAVGGKTLYVSINKTGLSCGTTDNTDRLAYNRVSTVANLATDIKVSWAGERNPGDTFTICTFHNIGVPSLLTNTHAASHVLITKIW